MLLPSVGQCDHCSPLVWFQSWATSSNQVELCVCVCVCVCVRQQAGGAPGEIPPGGGRAEEAGD